MFLGGMFLGAIIGSAITLCCVGSVYWRNDIDD